MAQDMCKGEFQERTSHPSPGATNDGSMSADEFQTVEFETRCKLGKENEMRTNLPGMRPHAKNQIARAQINQPRILGPGCCALYKAESVEGVRIHIVLAGSLDDSAWDCNMRALLECDACPIPCSLVTVSPTAFRVSI